MRSNKWELYYGQGGDSVNPIKITDHSWFGFTLLDTDGDGIKDSAQWTPYPEKMPKYYISYQVKPNTEFDQSTPEMYSNIIILNDEEFKKTKYKIPEDLFASGHEFRLYCVIDGVKTDVTDDPSIGLSFVDTNGNGIEDQMEWTVPEGINEFFVEAAIEIINVQSYPIVGGNWEVFFETSGIADLIITPVDETSWTDENIIFRHLFRGD